MPAGSTARRSRPGGGGCSYERPDHYWRLRRALRSRVPHHRAWLQAVLEQLVAHEPQALEEGGTLRCLWTAPQQASSAAPQPTPSAPPASPASCGNPLMVPWFTQLNSAPDQAQHMCCRSSCAILLTPLKPGVLNGPNGDDQNLAWVRQFGDTTDAAVQTEPSRATASTRRRFRN